jgi:hypothetical protein
LFTSIQYLVLKNKIVTLQYMLYFQINYIIFLKVLIKGKKISSNTINLDFLHTQDRKSVWVKKIDNNEVGNVYEVEREAKQEQGNIRRA